MDYSRIKVGDHVWLGIFTTTKDIIRKVVRVTPTQILLDTVGDPWRFAKRDGYEVGSGRGYGSHHITGYAAPAEVTARALAAAKREKQLRDDVAVAELNHKLQSLMPSHVTVSPSDVTRGPSNQSFYSLHGLSAQEIRKIARELKNL